MTLVPLIVVEARYVSVPIPVVDFTVKFAVPLVVFCGDAVCCVVTGPVGLLPEFDDSNAKLIEKVPAVTRFFFASTMLAVPMDVDEPSFLILLGLNEQVTPVAPPAVKTMVALVEETPVPSVNVTVHPDVAHVEL